MFLPFQEGGQEGDGYQSEYIDGDQASAKGTMPHLLRVSIFFYLCVGTLRAMRYAILGGGLVGGSR